MKCPHCQQDNLDNAKFCKNCGQPLTAAAAGQQAATPQTAVAPTMPSSQQPQAQPWQGPSRPPAPAPPSSLQQPASVYQGQQQPQSPAINPQPAPAWQGAPGPSPAPTGGTRTISRISAGSVFKVAAVIYGLLFAIFGCIFLVLPGILGAGLLDELTYELGLGRSGGVGIVVILVAYVLGILINALLSGLVAAVAALIYNLAANWIGGIEVEVV